MVDGDMLLGPQLIDKFLDRVARTPDEAQAIRFVAALESGDASVRADTLVVKRSNPIKSVISSAGLLQFSDEKA